MKKTGMTLLFSLLLLALLALAPMAPAQDDAYEMPDYGEANITEDDMAKLDAAMPEAAPAEPKEPRKVLVVDLNIDRGGHPSIPHANYMMVQAGERLGMWEATISHDQSLLDPEYLHEFDALFLNNTIGPLFDTPERQQALLDFLDAGKGLIGNHAVTVTSTDWEEFGEILGARGTWHRAADEVAIIQVEDPEHPLNASFAEDSFEFVDEFFRFDGPYSRDKVHVLLSIDPERTDMYQGEETHGVIREDNDYPISWTREYGNGRVFYMSLGHAPHAFWHPEILGHFLAGVQYALGDLEVN